MIFPTDIRPWLVVVAAIFLGAFSGTVSQLEPYTETISGTAVTFEMIPVPGGSFTMVDSADLRAERVVEVGDIWIGKTEVTWDEYDVWRLGLDHEPAERRGIDAELRPSRPYGAPDGGFGHSGFAALSVTAHAAEEYARWLSQKTGKNYRLPTTDEWRYVCYLAIEASKTTDIEMVSAEEYLDYFAWYAGNSGRAARATATTRPDALGIYDMLGNAGEWALDASGVAALHGGSYRDDAVDVHCGAGAEQTSAWNSTDPQIPKSTWWLSDGLFVGFRIVRDPEVEEGVR